MRHGFPSLGLRRGTAAGLGTAAGRGTATPLRVVALAGLLLVALPSLGPRAALPSPPPPARVEMCPGEACSGHGCPQSSGRQQVYPIFDAPAGLLHPSPTCRAFLRTRRQAPPPRRGEGEPAHNSPLVPPFLAARGDRGVGPSRKGGQGGRLSGPLILHTSPQSLPLWGPPPGVQPAQPPGRPPGGTTLQASTASPFYAWSITIVDPTPYAGMGTSLALDADVRPHIAYRCSPGEVYEVCYARFDGTAWLSETVDANAIEPSLALDAQDHPHIAYRIPYDYGDLRYAWHDGTSWYTETADAQGDTGSFPSLALDAQGDPHVSYANAAGCLMYAYRDAGTWHTEAAACGSGWYGWESSLELDSAERPHIIYQAGWPANDLMYAWHDGTDWQVEVVDSDGMVGYDTSLELDAYDHPHVSYYDATLGALKYAWHDGTDWHIEVVDDDGDVGTFTSLALDGAGRPHISYHDEDDYDLKYARFDGTAWQIERVDNGSRTDNDDRGLHTSVTLDAAGLPHISYYVYRPGGGHLRYAYLLELPYAVFLAKVER